MFNSLPELIFQLLFAIICSVIYDVLKKAFQNRPKNTSAPSEKYDNEYVKKVKFEFYISFFIGIVLASLPNTSISFINIAKGMFMYFSFFISLMGFMCMVDVHNNSSKNSSDKDH